MTSEAVLKPLKTVTLGCDVTLDIPEDWQTGPCSDDPDKWWCGAPRERNITLFVSSSISDLDEGRASIVARTEASIKTTLKTIIDIAHQQAAIGGVTRNRTKTGQVVYWAMKSGHEGGEVQSFVWYVVDGGSGKVVMTRFVLEMPSSYVNDPLMIGLRQMVDRQVPTAVPEIIELVDADYSSLREGEFGDHITFRYPAVWGVSPRPNASWILSGGRDEPGGVLVHYSSSPLTPEERRQPWRSVLLRHLRRFLDGGASAQDNFVMQDRSALDDGALLLWVEDTADIADLLPNSPPTPGRKYVWRRITITNKEIATATFTLILPLSLVEAPKFTDLWRQTEREIKAAQVTTL